jgi:hypothetical protein
VIVSARAGWEFADLGGRGHAGGGSHGSLAAGDSIVPILAAGFDEAPALRGRPSVTELAPALLDYLGVAPPAAMVAAGRELVRVA